MTSVFCLISHSLGSLSCWLCVNSGECIKLTSPSFLCLTLARLNTYGCVQSEKWGYERLML